MKVNKIFSIPVFSKSLSHNNDEISSYCKTQKEKNIQGNTISNVGGWQSNSFYSIPEELNDLFTSVQQFSEEVCHFMGISSVKFANAWININDYKDFNWTHSHIDSILSGVYYVKTPENCGNLIFENPCIESMEVSLTPERINVFNEFNCIGWAQKPESGLLCLFPGWVKHKVMPNMNESENRISISFNLT